MSVAATAPASRIEPTRRDAPRAAPRGPVVGSLAATLLLVSGLQTGSAAAATAPAVADPDWHIPLPSAPAAESGLAEPSHADYLALKAALGHYRGIAEAGDWQPVPPGPPLRAGMRDPRVELLRNRLRTGGDYASEMGADPWFFDSALDRALRRLQRRHLLPEDGVLGERTLEAANVPVGEVIGRIAVAMERWGWLPRDLGPRFVWVNIARAQLDVIENARSTLTMRVVVGHRDRPTPSLSGEISRVVFNPTWSVPATIAVEDLLPRQREDPQFLPRHRIRVFTGNGPAVREVAATSMTWNGPDLLRFPYRLVQDAGAGNSLGRIKIAFENPFDIYLHDTPAKGMFDLSTRTLSSGCVRLEDAAALATLLMANDRPWNESDTAARVQVGETRTLNLERTLPIYLVYMTVWSDGDGELRFGRDIYDRDAVVLSAIRARGASTASN